MKNLILFITAMVIGGLVYSQETRAINQNDLANSTLKLSKDWRLEIENQHILIKNGRISNLSPQNSGRMLLELYFSPSLFDLNSEKIEGYSISSFALKNTGGNSSLAGVSIQFADQNLPPDGKYFPILILTQAGKIKDIVQINYQVNVQNNTVLILQDEVNEITSAKKTTIPEGKEESKIVNSTISSTTNTSGFTNPNEPVKMIIENDNSITLEGDWKIEVDFKTFAVSLIGGDISNNTPQDVNHLKIDVFLTQEKQSAFSQNFNGLLIASVPFDSPIKAGNTFVDTTIKTNLRAIPAEGAQYILMTVSEVGDDGKTYLKSFRAFDDPFTPY